MGLQAQTMRKAPRKRPKTPLKHRKPILSKLSKIHLRRKSRLRRQASMVAQRDISEIYSTKMMTTSTGLIMDLNSQIRVRVREVPRLMKM